MTERLRFVAAFMVLALPAISCQSAPRYTATATGLAARILKDAGL